MNTAGYYVNTGFVRVYIYTQLICFKEIKPFACHSVPSDWLANLFVICNLVLVQRHYLYKKTIQKTYVCIYTFGLLLLLGIIHQI